MHTGQVGENVKLSRRFDQLGGSLHRDDRGAHAPLQRRGADGRRGRHEQVRAGIFVPPVYRAAVGRA